MSDDIKKRGYLSKLPVKGLMKKWIKRWFILHGTSHEGVVRVEYFDNKDSAVHGVGKRTIPLRDCSELTIGTGNKIHPYVFQFRSQIGHHVLSAESQPEMESWIDHIKRAVHEDKLGMRRSKTQSKVIASPDEEDGPPSLSESGLSYKNKVDSGTYRVTVEENDTSVKMNLSGSYSLELSPSKISLIAPSRTTIFNLQYKYLKNYGKQSGQFHFDTGKNSPIGEGKLIFVTTCSKEIFGVVHGNIKKLKEKMLQGRPAGKTGEQNQPAGKTSVQGRPAGKTSVQDRSARKTSAQDRPAGKTSMQDRPAERKTSVPASQRQTPPQQKKQHPTKISGSSTSRPGSRHSTEIMDSSIPGTYRTSKNLEEAAQGTIGEGDAEEEDPTAALYSTVDMSKKNPQKKRGTTAPNVPKPYSSNSHKEDAIYNEPYEADPNYRAPKVPGHRNSTRDSRVSYALVEIEDNAFNDSFDDDDDDGGGAGDESGEGNLMPLIEGATNPLDGSDLLNFNGGEPEASGLDFGFDLGAFQPTGANDPFNEHLVEFEGAGGTHNGNMAEFDLGTLDANFFERLEAIEVKDQVPTHGPQESLNREDFDMFWSNVDASVPKF